jgi:signal transduction histidine kinase
MNEGTLKHAPILIVDDEVASTCLLSNFLNRLGYGCVQAINDPTLIFEQITSFQPDLILLDLVMPNLNGFQVLEQLRQMPSHDKSVPVLVLTAEATKENKRKALAAGAADLLAKPFDPSEAIMRLRNLLQSRFLRLEIEEQNQMLEHRVAERTRQLEDALSDLKAAQRQTLQQERLHAFAEMAGGVVHDFSNALMSVIGYSEILIQSPDTLKDTATTLDYLRTMNTAGRDAAQVVSRLRDFYRPRDGGDPFAAADLNELVEQAVSLTQPRWKDQALVQGYSIVIEFDMEKVPPVNCNGSELREALVNLICNAADAMPAGGKITLGTRREPESVVLSVTDNGAGMSPEVRARCLEPFFTTKGDKGTGLGLSMVLGIIKRHEGTVEIESEPGQGTTFRIRLPSLVPLLASENSEEAALGVSLNVLVVDDEDVPRNVVTKYLTAGGHRVTTATCGREAMEKFHAEQFDLVLTDQGMPGMSGYELARALKQIRNSQPIILLTGFSGPAPYPKANSSEVDLIIHKPISSGELTRAITSVVK